MTLSLLGVITASEVGMPLEGAGIGVELLYLASAVRLSTVA